MTEELVKISAGKGIYVSQYAATAKAAARKGWKGGAYSFNALKKKRNSFFKNKTLVVDYNLSGKQRTALYTFAYDRDLTVFDMNEGY